MDNEEIFKEYAFKYDQSIGMVKYKYEHSLRVMEISKILAEKLNLSENDKLIAEFIGLTHDIARFEQWTSYKTFYDKISFDHGLRGVELLFDENLIKIFNVKKQDYNVIKTAIMNHNKFKIEDDLIDEKEILFSKLIRDADKLDIIYSFSTNRILKLDSDDSDINEKVKNKYFNGEQIDYGDIISNNDRIVEILSLIYDINFKYSFEYLKEKNYVNDLYDNLNNKDILKEYIDKINKFIEKRCK